MSALIAASSSTTSTVGGARLIIEPHLAFHPCQPCVHKPIVLAGAQPRGVARRLVAVPVAAAWSLLSPSLVPWRRCGRSGTHSARRTDDARPFLRRLCPRLPDRELRGLVQHPAQAEPHIQQGHPPIHRKRPGRDGVDDGGVRCGEERIGMGVTGRPWNRRSGGWLKPMLHDRMQVLVGKGAQRQKRGRTRETSGTAPAGNGGVGPVHLLGEPPKHVGACHQYPETRGGVDGVVVGSIEERVNAHQAIRAFCRRWNITEFALFGSLLRDDFGADSDSDVLVRFREGARYTLFDLARMGDELEAIFGRRGDLLDRQALEPSPNSIRRAALLRSAEVIYAER